MNKRFLLIIIIELVFAGQLISAQDVNNQGVVSQTTIDSTAKSLDVTSNKRQNKLSFFKFFKRKPRVHSDDKKKDEGLQILKDSVAKLNDTIDTLHQQKKHMELLCNYQQTTIDSLKLEVQRLNGIIENQIVSTFGGRIKAETANNFYCFAVMESPLYYNYDKQRVERSLNTARAMGYYNRGHKFNWIYNVYYDLLINYAEYNAELIKNINTIIEQFSLVKPNREFEKRRFEERLAASKYYQIRGKDPDGEYRHIFYLDFQIERVRELFKNDADFKKAKFKEILEQL